MLNQRTLAFTFLLSPASNERCLFSELRLRRSALAELIFFDPDPCFFAETLSAIG